MPSNVELLRGGRYAYEPMGVQSEGGGMGAPMPNPAPPSASPGTSYAALLAESRQSAPPQAVPPSTVRAMPPAGSRMAPSRAAANPGNDTADWMDAEQKQMYEDALAAYSNYHDAVAKRRSSRKQSREYERLYHQYKNETGQLDTMNNMLKKYPKMFPKDDAGTVSFHRERIKRSEKARRIQDNLRQLLQKKGVKIGPDDELPEDPFGEAGDDEGFDNFIKEGYMESRLSPYGR